MGSDVGVSNVNFFFTMRCFPIHNDAICYWFVLNLKDAIFYPSLKNAIHRANNAYNDDHCSPLVGWDVPCARPYMSQCQPKPTRTWGAGGVGVATVEQMNEWGKPHTSNFTNKTKMRTFCAISWLFWSWFISGCVNVHFSECIVLVYILCSHSQLWNVSNSR